MEKWEGISAALEHEKWREEEPEGSEGDGEDEEAVDKGEKGVNEKKEGEER